MAIFLWRRAQNGKPECQDNGPYLGQNNIFHNPFTHFLANFNRLITSSAFHFQALISVSKMCVDISELMTAFPLLYHVAIKHKFYLGRGLMLTEAKRVIKYVVYL